MALEGRCLCGGVTYSCDADPVLACICHCTECQRQTGSAFSSLVALPADRLEVRGESLRTFVTVGEDHGTPTRRSFCSSCGSPIVSHIDALPELAFVKSGTLDDPRSHVPSIEFWCRSAQPWAVPLPAARRLPRGGS